MPQRQAPHSKRMPQGMYRHASFAGLAMNIGVTQQPEESATYTIVGKRFAQPGSEKRLSRKFVQDSCALRLEITQAYDSCGMQYNHSGLAELRIPDR